MAQRKGRTGCINIGYYFRLITNKLYNKLPNYPTAEIKRRPLETPILKLKIYEPEKEPIEIIEKTIEPSEEDKIINTLFRLEKMGTLIQGDFPNKRIGIFTKEKKENDLNVISTKAIPEKIIFKSGIITKVGRIFTELPINIKYSRLIMISYTLGEIDLGITLTAIIFKINQCFWVQINVIGLIYIIQKIIIAFKNSAILSHVILLIKNCIINGVKNSWERILNSIPNLKLLII